MSKSPSSPIHAVLAPLLLILAASCSSGSSGNSNHSPTVLSNVPLGNAVDVPVNASMSATFSEAMNANTLTDVTFTVTQGLAAVPVAGTVIYANSTAVFWPAVHLADNEDFTATITRGAQDSTGNGLAVNHVWTFTTGTSLEPGQGVDLGQSGNFVILAKAGISTVPASVITGNVGLSPAAASFLTGFSLTMDPSNAFSTSTQVTGNVYAADYAAPTPTNLTTSVLDMETAFTDAARVQLTRRRERNMVTILSLRGG